MVYPLHFYDQFLQNEYLKTTLVMVYPTPFFRSYSSAFLNLKTTLVMVYHKEKYKLNQKKNNLKTTLVMVYLVLQLFKVK